MSASTTSRSQNSSIRSRCSTTVTLQPSAANMDAYSMPITPAPATTMVRGTLSRCTQPSESMMVRSSNATLGGRAGRVPTAITMLSAVTVRSPAVAVVHLDRVRVGEPPGAGQDRHPVAGELAAHHVGLPADHVPGAVGQVGDGDLVLDPVALPVHLPLVQAGQVEHRLAHGLGRDRAGVQAHPADHVGLLHDRYPAIQLGGRDRRFLPAGPRTDDNQVVIVHDLSLQSWPR